VGQDLVDWAAVKAVPAESVKYKRLTDADRISVLTLHEQGLTQTEIAKRLSRSVSTINDVIQTYAPTVDLAKRKLRAAAERMAENIIDNGEPRDHIQALKGLGVLHEQATQGLTVLIGGGSQVMFGGLSPLIPEGLSEGE
jgi:hypothetical protein